MADSRSVMQEFRFLDQKRQAGTLTAAEAARHAELRDLVGFEEPHPARGGFDVGAAAAQLRESLLPAGLRSRPLGAPAPPAPPPPTEPEIWTSAEPAEPAAVEPAEPAATPDALFDPASLGQEVRPQAWNPEAPGYDPDAPYDEAAWIAAGYDPNATYDWSAVGAAEPPTAEAAPPVEAAPLEFGEYDAAGAPLPPGAAPGPAPEPPPATDAGGDWLDDTGAAAEPIPPLSAPSFGEYDASTAALATPDSVPLPAPAPADESSYGGPEGDGLPGGEPLDLGDSPEQWLPEGELEVGFELASDGSFGAPAPAPQAAPWSTADATAAKETWESPPALDLSTPFEPLLIPASRQPQPPAPLEPEPLATLEPEELLEPLPEAPPELRPEPAGVAGFEALPAEAAWPPEAAPRPAPAPPSGPPPAAAAPRPPLASPPAQPPPRPSPPPPAPATIAPVAAAPVAAAADPAGLGELDASFEIDIPPEIAAAYDQPAAAPPPPQVASTPPAAAARVATPPAGPAAAPEPHPELEPELLPLPAGGEVVEGTHRVVVHTLDGKVLRGSLIDADLEAEELALETGAPGAAEPVFTNGVKAIFFMLTPGEQTPAPAGKRVRVTFRDGRQVAGFSPDYHEGGVGFFMIPADTRTNTRRIWVYQAAVKQITVS